MASLQLSPTPNDPNTIRSSHSVRVGLRRGTPRYLMFQSTVRIKKKRDRPIQMQIQSERTGELSSAEASAGINSTVGDFKQIVPRDKKVNRY